jgi:hypothetical protein
MFQQRTQGIQPITWKEPDQTMSKVYVPAHTADDWRQSLMEPDNRSAAGLATQTLARCWQASDGFPACVRRAFQNSGTAIFNLIEPLIIIPGHRVGLPGNGPDAPSDIFVLARSASQLVSLMVEGQNDTSFGQTVAAWYGRPSPDRHQRLEFLCSELNIPVDGVPNIPYRLLHSTAAAKVMAHRFQAGVALMLVHAFSPAGLGFDAYAAFAALFGIRAQRNTIQPVLRFDGLILYLGWADGDPVYRTPQS